MIHKTVLVLGAALLAAPALAQTPLTTVRVASGLVRPLYVVSPPGDFARLFIVEQRGSGGVATRGDIRILKLANNTLNATPFLSVNGVTTGSEQGLLGLAFHPDYTQNGYFYVNYTTTGGGAAGQTIVARYRASANPDVADPNSALVLLAIPQPFSNHNGGWIGFGPDGYLYVAMGDGGSAGDPSNFAQNPTSLLGKMLRINVDIPAAPLNYSIPPTNPFFGSPTARQEIWATGLRNPWRNAFDRNTGQFYIADVGQNAWEEINIQPAGSSPVCSYGGPLTACNYGWRCYEGNAAYNAAGCLAATNYTFPVHVYGHALGCSVTGGYVYRGCAIPDLRGTYFFADYCTASIWSFVYTGTPNPPVTDRTAELAPGGGLAINAITSFGEDAYGEMYIVDGGGEVFRIRPAAFVGPDCNNNARRDECDILSGYSSDGNNNGIPDECECYANCNGDWNAQGQPILNLADFGCFQTKFATGHMYADCNGDGVLNLADFGCFQTKFAVGCP